MKYKAIIFDLDGTILSTLDDLADSVNYALSENGYPNRSTQEVRRFVGNGIRKLIERSCPKNLPQEKVDKVHSDFTRHYKIHCNDKTCAYNGVPEMLYKLKQEKIKLAVLSNKADYAVKDLCKLHFDGYFDSIAGEKEGIPRKPAPDGVYAVLKELGVSANECAYVGDSDVDIETANNAGLSCITVGWGFRDRDELIKAGATCIVSSTDELTQVLI